MLYKVVTLYYYSTSPSSESGMFETKWRLIRKSALSWQSHGKNMGEWKHFVLTNGAVGKILNCDHWKPMSSTLLWYCWLCCIKLFQRLGCGLHIVLCEPSDESYWAVRPCNAVYFVSQEASNFWVCRWNPNECQWPFKWKLLSRTFLWYCLLCCKNRFQLCGLGMKSSCLTLQIKATEHYFSAMLVILLHKMLP